MANHLEFTLDYSKSVDGGYVGFIREVRGVMSQGETISELKENIKDALKAMMDAKAKIEEGDVPLYLLNNPKSQPLAVC